MKLNKKKVKTLNTHGCCLFCLKTSFNSDFISENVEKRTPVLLRCLNRYLKINPNHFECNSSNTPTLFKTSEQMDLEVELCESCEKLNTHFSVLFQQFEKTQMEMNYFLERIQQNISNSVKSPERVQNYSKKMTSNQQSLTELVFVDKLRKEIAHKSFKNEGPRVCVTRMNVEKIIKSEVNHENGEDSGSQSNSPLPPEEDVEVGEIFSCRDLIKQEPSEVLSTKYDCTSCKKPFTSSSGARRHYESIHLNKKFKCNSCNGVYSSRSTLRRHKSTCKGTGSKRNTLANVFYTRIAGSFKCKKCDKTYKQSTYVVRHYRAVHLNERYNCDQCHSAFLTPFNLQMHKKICQKAINKRLAMENDPTLKYRCKLCGSRFPLAKKLRQHNWAVHLNVNRYECEFCNRKFKRSSHLNDHKNAFHLGKKFPCRFCKKDFAYMYVTRIHEKKCAREQKIKVEPQDEA